MMFSPEKGGDPPVLLVSAAGLVLLVVRSRYDPLYIRDLRFLKLYREILNQIASVIG